MVTVVYVSYNNLNMVSQSIDSLLKYNKKYKYKISVVAYMFTDENLRILKSKYSFIEIIVSNVFRGFSENNNLALKKVKSEFCLVFNDDTFVKDNSIDKLVDVAIDRNLKILSPRLLYPDGSLQFNGRPRFGLFGLVLNDIKLIHLLPTGSMHKVDLFKTYNVSGACFLIRTDFFKSIGFFNEDYFFTPEDIEISNKAKKRGVYPYVYTPAFVYHISSMTAKKIHQVTIPAAKQGSYIYLNKNYGFISMLIYKVFVFFISIVKILFWLPKRGSDRKKIMIKACINCIYYLFRNLTPKEIFKLEMKKIY